MPQDSLRWPALEWKGWRDTALTLQLWTQIVGKVRLSCTPWLNHSWHVTLYVSAHGLQTGPISYGGRTFDLEFDLTEHILQYRDSSGDLAELPLQPQTVSEFHEKLLTMLRARGIDPPISGMPNEIDQPVPFAEDDAHRSYDRAAVERFFTLLRSAFEMLSRFRTGFLGKASPVHFFWGSFDLAVTRFSGRRAPLHPGGFPNLPNRVAQEAYSHEVSSAGFWPGNDAFPHAAFYSYAYPEPPGFAAAPTVPRTAHYNADLGEFLLPLSTVRESSNPEQTVMDFLKSSYEAAAELGKWDRAELECAIGEVRRVRSLPR